MYWPSSSLKLRGLAGGLNDVDHVIADLFIDVDSVYQLAGFLDCLERGYGIDLNVGRSGGHAIENLAFVRFRGVADFELEHEAIDLCLGERVGAFLIDRILGGQD